MKIVRITIGIVLVVALECGTALFFWRLLRAMFIAYLPTTDALLSVLRSWEWMAVFLSGIWCLGAIPGVFYLINARSNRP